VTLEPHRLTGLDIDVYIMPGPVTADVVRAGIDYRFD
jgi:hypothetical protein